MSTFNKKKVGLTLPTPTHQTTVDSDPESFNRKVRAHAFALLAGRELSREQLINRLLRYGASIELAIVVVDDLRKQGYQSDSRMAQTIVNSGLRQGKGPTRIRQKLHENNIQESLLDQPLSELDWLTRAENLRVTRFGADHPIDAKERARQCRFLAYRGFSTDICLKVVLGHHKLSNFNEE